jgi:uncharacterized membrane protein YsdA (DUF1294 family)/cold shock CspA family protein
MSPVPERVSGRIVSWNETRGFGFARPDLGGADVFVHISMLPSQTEPPPIGAELSFEVEVTPEGKRRAARVSSAGEAAPPTRRHQPRRLGYLVIVGFLALAVLVAQYVPIPWWIAPYYLLLSLVCFVAYAIDKRAARAGTWRVPEATLLVLGAIGGWPGAIVAQQTLRHKTIKSSFLRLFWGSVVLNVLGFIVVTVLPYELIASGVGQVG